MPKEVAATVVLLLLLTTGLTGCEKGAPPSPEEQVQAPKQPSAEETQALQQLQSYAQEKGLTLQDVMQRLTQPQPEGQTVAPPSVQPDLKVLGWLLGLAKKSAASQDAANAAEWIKQANRMARAVLAETPAQQVAVAIERATTAVSAQPQDATAASTAIAAAVDFLARTPDQTLVPDVAARLKVVQDGLTANPAGATTELNALLAICAQDKPATWAYQIGESLSGATEALGREAWPVVTAEIEQAEALMKKIGDQAAGPATTAPATGSGPASGAGATTPAPGSAPATGQGQMSVPAPAGVVPQPPAGQSAGKAKGQ